MSKYHYLVMSERKGWFYVSLVSEMIGASELQAIFRNEGEAHKFIELKIKELGVEYKTTMTFKFVGKK